MTTVTLMGKAFQISGNLPKVGVVAFNFVLVGTDLSDIRLSDFAGCSVIMNIFPSVETQVCAQSVRRVNEMAKKLDNTKVLCISKDLPFTHERFNKSEGIDNVISLSEFRNNHFGLAYGIVIEDGPFTGLFSRAVVALNPWHRVIYTQLVPEIGEEPDYDALLDAMESIPACTVAETAAYPPTESGADEICVKRHTTAHERLSTDDVCHYDRFKKI
jgi:thioredoxin-dependent peroxiredoxin